MAQESLNRQQLWAPWRHDYVSGNYVSGDGVSENCVSGNVVSAQDPLPEPIDWQPRADRQCFLCKAACRYADQAAADRQNLVVWQGPHVFVVLNRFPYNNGHVLVAPTQHVGPLAELSEDQHMACMDMLSRLTEIFTKEIQAAGFNIGLNLGEAAGAGVPGHLHWHLVPRWPGDQNFMPVTGNTSVIPQSLDSMWNLLNQALVDMP